MLTARNTPRACQSCRLQLLSLFEHGFTSTTTKTTSRARFSANVRIPLRAPQSRQFPSIQRFSTTGIRAGEAHEETPTNTQSPSGVSATEIESFVRQARQTFGETLPKDYLSTEEYILYERLYGPPLRETQAEDLEYLPEADEEIDGDNCRVRDILLRERPDGQFEEIDFDPGAHGMDDVPANGTVSQRTTEMLDGIGAGEQEQGTVAVNPDDDTVQVHAKNQREVDAIARLQHDMDAAMAQPLEEEEDMDEEFEEDEEDIDEEEDYEGEQDVYITSESARAHPHTMTGRFGTSPSTLSLPKKQLVEPITELLERADIKHVAEAAEKAFGGKGLPHSTATPGSKKSLPQRHIGLDAAQHHMSEIEADAYLASVTPGTYASVMSTLVEVRKRLGSNWVRDLILRKDGGGPRVLDAGAGGAGIVAWQEVVQAEWDMLKDEGLVQGVEPPSGKRTVLTGASTLRHRASRLLENTTFLPRLPDYIHAANYEELLDGGPAQSRKAFDVIIAPHRLMPLKEDHRRKHMVQNLWSLLDPNGGVLILIEKGFPRGFEAIAGARSLLLDTHISSPGDTPTENEIQAPDPKSWPFTQKEEGMIIAPCTNHTKCPMYPAPGMSSGRKDFCHFNQRFIRPPYLQRILRASARNHEDVNFSYIAVRRGIDARKRDGTFLQEDAATLRSFTGYENEDLPETESKSDVVDGDVKFHPMSLPRAILPPLKRRGHVTLDLCTPSGKLERWTVPKSFSGAAYRDARKSKWGDLWALGAKTRIQRHPRLGKLGEDGKPSTALKGVRDGKMGKGGKKVKANQFNIMMGKEGMERIEEAGNQRRIVGYEKRTKRGRVWKEKKPLTEADFQWRD